MTATAMRDVRLARGPHAVAREPGGAAQPPAPLPGAKKRVAILLSCDSFETFFGSMFGLSRDDYVASYRNDFAWYYARGLAGLGHEVTIYILSYGDGERTVVEEGISVRFVPLPGWVRLPSGLSYRLRRFSIFRRLRDAVPFSAYRRELAGSLAADDIDVLYVQEFWTDRFDLLVRHIETPIIGAEHGGRFVAGTEAAKRASLPRAHRLTCQDDRQLEQVRCLGADAVLLRNAVDTDFFTPPAARQRTKTVLAVGRLVDEHKRFSDLIRALTHLPDFHLTIVGSGPDEAKLRRIADECLVAERVHFAGFISDRHDLRRYYQNCTVFASASAWEAVALVMLEAMACGAAVVGTHIPAFETLLVDAANGYLVPVQDPAALAQGLLRAWENASALGRLARQTVVNDYSATSCYETLSALIQAVG